MQETGDCGTKRVGRGFLLSLGLDRSGLSTIIGMCFVALACLC